MNIKAQVLRQLVESQGGYLSGEIIAKNLSVSRNAVWKAVASLCSEGYVIAALRKKGYRLESYGNTLSPAGIYAQLKNESVFHFDVRNSVASTNTLLREMAAKNLPEGYVLTAEEQTQGKGRMGRSFHSPAKHGIYLSLLLRPASYKTDDSSLITCAAAVATARAIEAITNLQVGIKWVNDLLIGEKKVCGILTEATFDMESGRIDNAVLGIGVNISKPKEGYPDDLESVATSLIDRHNNFDGIRCRLIAAILDEFWGFYVNLSAREFLSEYKARSILLGKDIMVVSNDSIAPAKALDIDDACRLIVRFDNGETTVLSSGEVSIRQINQAGQATI